MDIKKIQRFVDRSVKKLRVAGIPLEDIFVEEKETKGPLVTIPFCTISGKIYVNPKKVSDILDFHPELFEEYLVAHELGHRTHRVLNPDFNNILYRGLGIPFDLETTKTTKTNAFRKFFYGAKLIISGNLVVPYCINEGIAESFALDLLPKLGIYPPENKFNIRRIRQINIDLTGFNPYISQGYSFFHPLAKRKGLSGMIEYIRDFTESDVPTRRDIKNPIAYWENRK